ncbi:MAG: type II CRISPR-associated endonuclease Cas1 [Candidatus Hydrogenedens sp.]|nr:type II CRISPR-associated endonuclease Cas1 [Candidatus Hydrogenedens sp.]
MNNRVLDFSAEGVFLSIKHGQLVVKRESVEPVTVPMEDVAVVVVSHPGITYTQAVLSELAAQGGIFVVCDGRRLPSAMLLPLEGHHLQRERLELQVNAGLPEKKRAWQQVVQAKIRAQAAALRVVHGSDAGLDALAAQVKSGDGDNLEGAAARRYWQALFPGGAFRRDRDAGGANELLNYGYAVIRAITARAIAGAGLHASLGIHHHNRYDAFCLADDLMEPFRPLIDIAVARLEADVIEAGLTPATKRLLLEAAGGRVLLEEERRSVFDAAALLAASLAAYYAGKRKKLLLPAVPED